MTCTIVWSTRVWSDFKLWIASFYLINSISSPSYILPSVLMSLSATEWEGEGGMPSTALSTVSSSLEKLRRIIPALDCTDTTGLQIGTHLCTEALDLYSVYSCSCQASITFVVAQAWAIDINLYTSMLYCAWFGYCNQFDWISMMIVMI